MGTEHERELLADRLESGLGQDGPDPDSLLETTLSVDDLFEVLAHPENRYVLTYLIKTEEPVYTHELVEHVASVTEPPAGLSEREYRGQINSRLLHASFPKLEEAGLIAFDERRQRISETDETVVTLPYLRMALLQQRGEPAQ